MARTPPPLPTITLPGSGYTVEFRPIGPLTMGELSKAVRKELPAPEPPRNTVTGLDGKQTQEANDADPAYQAALTAHEAKVNQEIGNRVLKLLARRIVTTPDDLETAQQMRADLAELDVTVPDDDREVFLLHVLVGDQEDLTALQAAFMRRSQPTEEAIQEKVADFPGDVPGS